MFHTLLVRVRGEGVRDSVALKIFPDCYFGTILLCVGQRAVLWREIFYILFEGFQQQNTLLAKTTTNTRHWTPALCLECFHHRGFSELGKLKLIACGEGRTAKQNPNSLTLFLPPSLAIHALRVKNMSLSLQVSECPALSQETTQWTLETTPV